uniref:Uncharacterized protein n=1 Tax=Lygus hesperus TaxID=30085 RepID=A0A146KPF9_LYGHE
MRERVKKLQQQHSSKHIIIDNTVNSGTIGTESVLPASTAGILSSLPKGIASTLSTSLPGTMSYIPGTQSMISGTMSVLTRNAPGLTSSSSSAASTVHGASKVPTFNYFNDDVGFGSRNTYIQRSVLNLQKQHRAEHQ